MNPRTRLAAAGLVVVAVLAATIGARLAHEPERTLRERGTGASVEGKRAEGKHVESAPARDARGVLALDATTHDGPVAPARTPASTVATILRRYAGRVVDETDSPLAAVEVGVARAGGAMDERALLEWAAGVSLEGARSSLVGAFELAARVEPDSWLVARYPGRALHVEPVPSSDREDLLVRLVATEHRPYEALVTGRVVDADGRALARADVRLGPARTLTRDDGTFELRSTSMLAVTTPLVATFDGRSPAVVPAFGARVLFGPLAPVELVIGGPATSIAGHVFDADGAPLAGWDVALLDGTSFEPERFPWEQAEAAAAGVERVRTDAQGAFELGGLGARPYRLVAFSYEAFASLVSDPIPAGTRDARLVVPRDRDRRVAGVVRDAQGRPVADAVVSVRIVLFSARSASRAIGGEEVTTNARGEFVIERVPRRGARLVVDGRGVVPASVEVPPGDEEKPLELVVRRRASLRVVDVPAESGARSAAVVDESGARTELWIERDDGARTCESTARLVEGASPTFHVAENACVLLFLDGDGRELARRTLRLDPLAPNRVAW